MILSTEFAIPEPKIKKYFIRIFTGWRIREFTVELRTAEMVILI
jgi:hypothetical protein